jgi:hypothetical protein
MASDGAANSRVVHACRNMRKLTKALNVNYHMSAVMVVDFSPTGEELASGS